jgi:hypothetical protein
MSLTSLARGVRAIVLGLCVSTGAAAQVQQLPVKFDFKPAGYPTVPGSIAVDETALFGVKGDFGFSAAPLDAKIGDNPVHDVVDRGDDDRPFIRGCVRLASGTEFSCFVLPNQQVRARVLLAHVPAYWKPGTQKLDSFPTALADLRIEASDGSALRVVAQDIDLRTAHVKSKPVSDIGSYRKIWLTARADAQGKLRIKFASANGALIPVSAIHLYSFVAMPIVYRRQGATWLAPASGGSLPGLAEFHAKDFAGARRKFLTIGDPLTRATALLWLAGWFESSEEGYLEDIAIAETTLRDHSLAANPRAIELLDRIDDWQVAELHYGLRNYSFATALPPDGLGYFNPAYPDAKFAVMPGASGTAPRHLYLAENLYYQTAGTQSLTPIIQHNAGSNPDAFFEVFPLAFRALDRVARLHFAMNSLHTFVGAVTPDSENLLGIELYEALWQAFDSGGFRTQEFSECAELGVMCWVASPNSHDHSQNGGVFGQFTGTPIPTSYFDPAKAWWTPLIQPSVAAPSDAQPWAGDLRRYSLAYRAVLDWWLERRLVDGEFGGGSGDDAELVPLISAPLQALRQPNDDAARQALSEAADGILLGPNVADGYYTGIPIDVEHSAEFTSYPLRTVLGFLRSDPWYLDFALAATEHLTSPGSPSEAWAGADGAGDLRFHSFHFSAEGPPSVVDPQYDGLFVDLLLPGFHWMNRGPPLELASAISAWTDSWKLASLADHAARPRGLVPASISSGIEGPAPNSWWVALQSGPSGWDFPFTLPSFGYLYSGAFASCYRAGGPNAHEYLVPLISATKGIIQLENDLASGQPVPGLSTVGAKNWALDRLRTSSSFIDALAISRGAIAGDPLLRTIDDPYTAGSDPYVDDAFLAAVDTLLTKYSYGYLPYFARPQLGTDPGAGQYEAKKKSNLIQSLRHGAIWLEHYFPLATSHALFTDRVLLFQSASHDTLVGAYTGEIASAPAPRPVLSIAAPANSIAPLDIAVLVNDLAVKENTTAPRLRVLLYDFEAVPRAIDIHFFDRLPFGRYRVRLGACDPTTDYFAAGFSEATFDLAQIGTRLAITLPAQSLQLLELEWIQSLPPLAGFDLAVSPKSTTATIGGSLPAGYSITTSTRVYNTAPFASPGNSLRLYVSLLDTAGNPVALDQFGTLVVEIPITNNHPPLPPIAGFTLPSATVSLSYPLAADLVNLLALGYQLRFEYRVNANGDFDSQNDVASVTVGW